METNLIYKHIIEIWESNIYESFQYKLPLYFDHRELLGLLNKNKDIEAIFIKTECPIQEDLVQITRANDKTIELKEMALDYIDSDEPYSMAAMHDNFNKLYTIERIGATWVKTYAKMLNKLVTTGNVPKELRMQFYKELKDLQ
jgi:hypothetical protein